MVSHLLYASKKTPGLLGKPLQCDLLRVSFLLGICCLEANLLAKPNHYGIILGQEVKIIRRLECIVGEVEAGWGGAPRRREPGEEGGESPEVSSLQHLMGK